MSIRNGEFARKMLNSNWTIQAEVGLWYMLSWCNRSKSTIYLSDKTELNM